MDLDDIRKQGAVLFEPDKAEDGGNGSYWWWQADLRPLGWETNYAAEEEIRRLAPPEVEFDSESEFLVVRCARKAPLAKVLGAVKRLVTPEAVQARNFERLLADANVTLEPGRVDGDVWVSIEYGGADTGTVILATHDVYWEDDALDEGWTDHIVAHARSRGVGVKVPTGKGLLGKHAAPFVEFMAWRDAVSAWKEAGWPLSPDDDDDDAGD